MCTEFAEHLFENPPQRPRYIQESVRKDFGARSPRRDAEPRRTALRSRSLRCAEVLSIHDPEIKDIGVGIQPCGAPHSVVIPSEQSVTPSPVMPSERSESRDLQPQAGLRELRGPWREWPTAAHRSADSA